MAAELKNDALIVGHVEAKALRAAAVHVADRIAAEHPTLQKRVAGLEIDLAIETAINASLQEGQ